MENRTDGSGGAAPPALIGAGPGDVPWACDACKHGHFGPLAAFVCSETGCACPNGQHLFTGEIDAVLNRPLCANCRITDLEVEDRCPGKAAT